MIQDKVPVIVVAMHGMRPPCMKVRSRHVSDRPWPAKEHTAAISLNQPRGKVDGGVPNNLSNNLIRAAVSAVERDAQ
jgi:hypothetical protein